MNHTRGSGSVVRFPRGLSWTLFVHQEWSHDWSAESTHARCHFCPVSGSFYGLTVWVCGMHFELRTGTKGREMHRNAACFEPRWQLTFSVVRVRSSKLNPGPCTKRGSVQRVSHWTTYSETSLLSGGQWTTYCKRRNFRREFNFVAFV